MSHDSRGAPLKKGDRVFVEAVLREDCTQDDGYCNATIDLIIPDQPAPPPMSAPCVTVNTRMLTKIGASLVLLFVLLICTAAQSHAATMLEENNAIRARYNLPPMVIDSRLQSAAQNHADYMAAHRTMDHFVNGTPSSRAAMYGYRGAVAENIAMGYSNPWQAWINSPGHFRNLTGNYNVCGLAVAYSGSTPYWCAVYGFVSSPPIPQPPIVTPIPPQPPRPNPRDDDAQLREILRRLLDLLEDRYTRQSTMTIAYQPQYQSQYQSQYQPQPQQYTQPLQYTPQYATQSISGSCGRRRCR